MGIKSKIKRAIFAVLKLISYIIPKSKRIWLFGAWGGELYADNTKYLFEYLHTINTRCKLVWISKNNSEIEKIREKGFLAYNRRSIKGLWYIARGKVAFCTEGTKDISYQLNKKTKIIQLWHGMGSKAMKWKTKDGKISTESKKAQKKFSRQYWISTSNLYTNIISELLGVPKERFVITGYPRNDNLLVAPYNENMEGLRQKYNDCKFIIYMPTHRNFGKDGNKHINVEELKRVDKLLCEKNIVMVYKPHIHELKNFVEYENDFSNIILAKEQDEWGDVYSYIHYFDLLISDYSSILTDFMCTGNPVVLFPYDIDDYINGDAGLNEYFWRIPGGPMGYNWNEVLAHTEALLENDTWQEEREKCRQEYHYYNDGKNCERVYQMIKNILKIK